ncbi:MAG: AMP-binding protein, partial [Methylocystaceae bacterium]
LEKGDRVGIFMGNCPQYTIAHFGTQKMGGIVCPCSPLFKEYELEYELNDAGVEVLVTWDILLPVVERVLSRTSVKKVVVTRLQDFIPESPPYPIPDMAKFPALFLPGADDFLTVISNCNTLPRPIEIDLYNDICLLQYTGGTTGLPKGSQLSYYAALFKTAVVSTVAGINPRTVSLVTMPIFHIAGMVAGMNSCLFSGATQVQVTQFDVVTVMEVLQKYQVDFWYSAVPMNLAIMAHPRAREYVLSSLSLCLTSSFGIALSEEISRRWSEFTEGGVLIEGAYGLSETHTADTYMPKQLVKYGSMGIPTYEAEFKIVDLEDAAQELLVGETGEIALKTPALFKGYWNQAEETAATLRDGWLYTGDVGKFDEDGYLYLVGRKKEMIKVSGYSVYPEEVESILNQHPAVLQSAVIGVPDERRGEVVKAFIVRKPGVMIEEDELISWARQARSEYKAPVFLEFRTSLPTLGTGKLLRRVLKDDDN